jgi:hypothetical protein
MPGKQEGKPITQGLQTGKAREDYPFKDPAKRGKGRPMGSVNRYTGALKELFLLAAENVGDRLEIGPNGERHGEGGALAFLETCAITERKTFLTVMARLLPITIKTAPPLKKVLTPWRSLGFALVGVGVVAGLLAGFGAGLGLGLAVTFWGGNGLPLKKSAT